MLPEYIKNCTHNIIWKLIVKSELDTERENLPCS